MKKRDWLRHLLALSLRRKDLRNPYYQALSDARTATTPRDRIAHLNYAAHLRRNHNA